MRGTWGTQAWGTQARGTQALRQIVDDADPAHAEFFGNLAENIIGLGKLREPNHSPAWPQDAGLLARNGGQGRAQPLGVVERDVGDDGEERIDDVGCVEE